MLLLFVYKNLKVIIYCTPYMNSEARVRGADPYTLVGVGSNLPTRACRALPGVEPSTYTSHFGGISSCAFLRCVHYAYIFSSWF